MFAKHTLFLLAVALAEARFGQEQGNGAVQAISALGDIGKSGQAATLAGGSIQHLLAAANPCKKLIHADSIVETLGNDDRVIAAARGYVAAEQNFNPFNVKIPSVCAETDLPKTEALRGVVPLIDPDVTGQDVENANAKSSVQKPFDATGKSVAEVMAANGFTNFTGVKLDGTKVDLTGVKAKEASGVGGEADGGNKDNKSAAGDKKEEEEKASGAGQEKENEEKSKAAGEDENQKKIKACSALLSSIDKGKSAGADKKAAGSSEKKDGGKEDEKKAEAEEEEKDGGKKNEKKAEAEKDEKKSGGNVEAEAEENEEEDDD